jgi:hypothetical protein
MEMFAAVVVVVIIIIIIIIIIKSFRLGIITERSLLLKYFVKKNSEVLSNEMFY